MSCIPTIAWFRMKRPFYGQSEGDLQNGGNLTPFLQWDNFRCHISTCSLFTSHPNSLWYQGVWWVIRLHQFTHRSTSSFACLAIHRSSFSFLPSYTSNFPLQVFRFTPCSLVLFPFPSFFPGAPFFFFAGTISILLKRFSTNFQAKHPRQRRPLLRPLTVRPDVSLASVAIFSTAHSVILVCIIKKLCR